MKKFSTLCVLGLFALAFTVTPTFADNVNHAGQPKVQKEGLKQGMKNGPQAGAKDGLKYGLKNGLKDGLKYGAKNGQINGAKKAN